MTDCPKRRTADRWPSGFFKITFGELLMAAGMVIGGLLYVGDMKTAIAVLQSEMVTVKTAIAKFEPPREWLR